MRQRLQHIGDARLELEEAAAGRDAHPGRGPRGRAFSLLAVAGLLTALAGGLAGDLAWRVTGRRGVTTPAAPVARLSLRLEGESAGDLSLSVGRYFNPVALSPDGARLVFQALGPKGHQLFLRELSGLGTKALPGTENAITPFFSSDGRWVGFWRAEDHRFWRVPVSGGPPIEIGPTGQPLRALSGADDEILFEGADGGSWSISAFGGEPREVPIQDIDMVHQPDPERLGGVNSASGDDQFLGNSRSHYTG